MDTTKTTDGATGMGGSGSAGYLTVGEAARRMGVTVRTLQYYDREGVVSPSSTSEGGRRLYADRDLVRLHQVLSLKSLGFSLADIKGRLAALDTPAQVADVLAAQAGAVREQINALSETLADIEALRAEVVQMDAVDFARYADIVVNLRMGNALYGAIKHLDDAVLDHAREKFTRASGADFMERFESVLGRAQALMEAGAASTDDEGIALAQEFWELVRGFTDGDPALLGKLVASGDGPAGAAMPPEFMRFVVPALEAYFERTGVDPFAAPPDGLPSCPVGGPSMEDGAR